MSSTDIPAFHPSTKLYRFTLLIFISLLSLGAYFAYDIIKAIVDDIMQALQVNQDKMGWINSMYSFAAIPALFFGGYLLDKIGTRKASLIFSSFVVVGATIVAFAKTVALISLGRFLFGAGSETVIVAQSTILARWFKGRELALAFGITLTVSRLGSLFAFNTGAVIREEFGGPFYALLAAAIICGISLLANLVYIVMDKRGEKALNLRDESTEEKIHWKDVKFLNASFWYISAICVAFYSAVFPFQTLAPDFFQAKWNIPDLASHSGSFLTKVFFNMIHMFKTTGGMTSIIIFASMIFAPFAGRWVDKYGRRATVMIIGSVLMIPAHLLMGLTHLSPVPMMIVLGAAFVMVPASMWPSIPHVVRQERVGTAFGLMTAIQNIGLFLFDNINGQLRVLTGNYTASQIMFASLGIVGLVFSILLLKSDQKAGGILEKP